MTVLKCKMCGGDLKFEEGVTVVDCEYCGTKQTVPTIDDEKKITLFSRANRLRFACEFDKASGVYESIVADFPEEAEAYWGLVLCKYGIEYVDDPATGKKIPTCHRSSFESVMEDENFEQVLENADPIARSVYREEAKQIEELRRGIIEVSCKEEPYDIFICYKETAENGERTIDSVIAQDVYHELTEKGYRVFFSRITLEDKLGQEYEPYIFAALNSARIMLAFGTDYEYYNAVWVKNEWSRFLQLIAKGEKKTLIPCYKGIDAYDMPKEFAKLQAQDMGKVGAVQDLMRGIEKLLLRNANAEPASAGGSAIPVQQLVQSATTGTLLRRAFMYLEDGDWRNAAEYCNRVLDIEPENAEAYVGLLMSDLQVSKEEELASRAVNLGKNKYFIKAQRFVGEERKKVLEGYRTASADYILEQAFIFLEGCDWNRATDYCNLMLDINPKSAEAHVGLLMAELRVRKEEELACQTVILARNEHFIEAQRLASEERKEVLEGYKVTSADCLLEQAFIFLEGGGWSKAADYCRCVLDIVPENAEAHVGLLMAELRVRKEEELTRLLAGFDQNPHYLIALQFAGEERRKILEGYKEANKAYQRELQHAEYKVQKLKEEVATLRKKRADLKLQQKTVNEYLTLYQEDLGALTGYFARSKKAEIMKEIEKLNQQQCDITHELKGYDQDIIRLQQERATLVKKIERAKSGLQD